jgi:NADPH-dependent 2,4-dienoyl-CoA reductase/sulfur reductase-like enzyme/rhodanese-related sulfurtransferase
MKYIIVGGVAGGASTAARLRRLDEHAEILVFEKGEHMSYANCGLPYYIGEVIKDRNKLIIQTASTFQTRFNIDVRTRTEVTSIDRGRKTVVVCNRINGEIYEESYDKLVLSPGASPVRPPLPGINSEGIFTLRNVADTDRIKAYASKHKSGKAVVVGGGFIGLEMAENLYALGMKVSVVEMGSQILAPLDFPAAAIVQQHVRSKGVELLLNTSVSGFEKWGETIQVMIKGGEALDAQVVILSIGVKPDTALAAGAGLKLGPARGIWVNEFLQTSDPDIYAVGDAIEYPNPITGISMNTFLAGPANKQGRICADNIVFGNTRQWKGAIQTAIVKVFDLTAGATGVASKHLTAARIDHLVSNTQSASHAGYYPDAKQMNIQLTYAPDTGRLLGAQVVGSEGVDKRLDVFASIIRQGGTIYDLEEFEHAYAPPYSSAKDPVNMAGFVAENILQNRLRLFYWNEAEKLGPLDLLIDVRTFGEFASGTIPGAIHLPLEELRGRLSELPKFKNIYLFCQIGLRGYLAQRILFQNGYENTRNLSGGYSLWKVCSEEKALEGKPLSHA